MFASLDLAGRGIGVVGAGTMGEGIAQEYSERGAVVVVVDSDSDRARAAVRRIREHAAHQATIGGMPDVSIHVGTGFAALAPCEAVVEAVVEDALIKAAVLRGVEDAVAPDALLATNTSALSVAGLAAALSRPQRMCGMHFFNPVHSSQLVEVVHHGGTAPATLARAQAHVAALGKEAVVVRDSPGFASSRLGLVLGLEAMRMVEEGVASPADIDRAMTLGYRHASGPLRTSDLVGLDVRLAIADHLAATLGERFAAPAILRAKVAAGELGRKTGRGFFDWPERG